MTYVTSEPEKILVLDQRGYSRRFYPYPKECPLPAGISPLEKNIGFIVQKGQAIYGTNRQGKFYPAEDKP